MERNRRIPKGRTHNFPINHQPVPKHPQMDDVSGDGQVRYRRYEEWREDTMNDMMTEAGFGMLTVIGYLPSGEPTIMCESWQGWENANERFCVKWVQRCLNIWGNGRGENGTWGKG